MTQKIHAHSAEAVPDRDVEGDWRVEWFGSDGEPYLAIFCGRSAEKRARRYVEYLLLMLQPDPDLGDEPS